MTKIPFTGQTYADASLPATAQRCVNFYPTKSPTPEDPERVVLYPTPGYLVLFNLTHGVSGVTGTEVRGTFTVNTSLYVVYGNALLVIAQNSTSTYSATNIGSLNTSSGRVSIACNTVELVISDGSYGYTYNLTTKVFVGIGSGSWPATGGVTNVTFQDGYVVASLNNSNQVIQSDLLAGGVYDPQAFVQVAAYPDHNRAVFSDELQLYIFGPKVTEVRFNSGAIPFAFEKRQGVLIQAGCVAWATIVKVAGSMIWLASDAAGKAYIAALNGYSPQVLSTPPINEAMERYTTLSDAFAYTYREGDSQFYVITFPTEGATWAYDVRMQMWHERSYNGGADLPNCYALWDNGLGPPMHIVGTTDGILYVMSQNHSHAPSAESMSMIPGLNFPAHLPIRSRTSQHLRAGGRDIHLHELEIFYEAGVGVIQGWNAIIPDTALNPLATLEVSRDGGRTWTGVGTREMGQAGEYKKRLVWRKLGRAKCFTFRLTISDPVRTYIYGAEAKVTLAK